MLKVRVKLKKWDEALGDRVDTIVELTFTDVSNEDELYQKLKRSATLSRINQDIEDIESGEDNGVLDDGIEYGGISHSDIMKAYREDTSRAHRCGSPGGSEPVGKRKSIRECRSREKGRVDTEGEWNMNL